MTNPISIRPMLPKPGNGTINDQRVDLFNLHVPNPQTLGYPRSEFLDQHIRLFDELFGNLSSLLILFSYSYCGLIVSGWRT